MVFKFYCLTSQNLHVISWINTRLFREEIIWSLHTIISIIKRQAWYENLSFIFICFYLLLFWRDWRRLEKSAITLNHRCDISVKSMLTTIINGSIDIFGVYFTKLGKKKWLYYHKALLTNIMYVLYSSCCDLDIKVMK